MQWLSRTIAIVLIMVIPCYLGNLADKAWNTHIFAPLGIGAGMVVTIAVFLVMANSMIPKGRGMPLLDEETDDVEDEPHDKE